MHRHLVERTAFELHVVSNAEFSDDLLVHTPLRLPYAIWRLRKTRFGPRLAAWMTDYENLVWPLTPKRDLDAAIETFRPQVILTLAECGLCHIARRAAQRYKLPLVGLFLDWFPVGRGYYGHAWTQALLSRRYRELYTACDLAFCTSDGMQEMLGPHPNSHVVYPMPGRDCAPEECQPPRTGKFRVAYVGGVGGSRGRMLCSLMEKIEMTSDMEIIVAGLGADWPKPLLQRAEARGTYLGFKRPEQAAPVLAAADALLVVMGFEKELELFMRTSFTTKFLDYVPFGKPVILWGPEYCDPIRFARKHGGALVVNQNDPDAIISACRQIARDVERREQLSQEASRLHQTLFNPDRLQEVFVGEIEKLVGSRRGA
jgi:hypothetical protein